MTVRSSTASTARMPAVIAAVVATGPIGTRYLRRMEIVWQAWEGFGAEYLDVDFDAAEASGTFIRVFGDAPLRVDYLVRWDEEWRTHHVEVRCGRRRVAFDSLPPGCIDVDVMAATFTNTLPIRRLGLPIGASHQISAAFVTVPSLEVQVAPQRYTRLGANEYRYDGVDTGFTSVLTVDDDGLVIDYPQLSRRVILPPPRK